jgi:hypothetical protein
MLSPTDADSDCDIFSYADANTNWHTFSADQHTHPYTDRHVYSADQHAHTDVNPNWHLYAAD